jgi:hypothetical protein
MHRYTGFIRQAPSSGDATKWIGSKRGPFINSTKG